MLGLVIWVFKTKRQSYIWEDLTEYKSGNRAREMPVTSQFVSQQPRVPSSSLLVAWESSGGWPKALGPFACVGDPEEAPGSRSAQLRPLQSLGE